MTPAAAPPESPHFPRLSAALSCARLLIPVAAAALVLGGGCSKPPTSVATTEGAGAAPQGNPWRTAGARLKKETDPAATKAALSTLSSAQKLPALSDAELEQITALVPLSAPDREEIRGPVFTPHDAVYLADCLYLRDAARALALNGLPPEKQAQHAFDWVCRQVYLQPWLRQVGSQAFEATALPPTAVLRRGFGSGLERMYVFLALLQQLELEGCLIGGPDAGDQESRQGVPIRYPFLPQFEQGLPRGPFWAVGVRVGNDVRLFDPWRGQAFPVTLNQLKEKPESAKAWFEDKANLSSATPDDAKKATAFLAVPVNSLSPRMGAFEANLKGELGVKVAYDRKALLEMHGSLNPKPAFWNPVKDPFAYGRAARSYLPTDMGGSDRTPVSAGRLYEASLREQIPSSAFRMRDDLLPDPAQRLAATAGTLLGLAFVDPPNPRERIQRGQFQDAAKEVVAKQEAFAAGLERMRTQDTADQEKEIRAWVKEANEAYAGITRATLNHDKGAEAAALAQIESVWKQPVPQLLVDRLSAEVGRAEAAYLLALCKHEQAERLQIRLERVTGEDAAQVKPDALDAWKTALSAWRTYEQLSSAHTGFPGRAEHAKALAARAARFAQQDEKK